MDIKIIETGAEEKLNLVDPNTGINWINDLMGTYDALPDYDDGTGYYIMSREDYDWWADLTIRYQIADNRYNEIITTLDNDKYEAMCADARNIICDLEDYPEILMSVCDEYDPELERDD